MTPSVTAAPSPGLTSSGRASALTAIVLFTFLAPSFLGHVGSLGAAAINGGLAGLAACVILFDALRVRYSTVMELRWCLFLLGTMGYYLAAICFSTAFLSEQVIVRDLFELHKPVLYALSLLLPFVLVRGAVDVAVFERALGVAFIGIVALALLQLTAPPAFGQIYTKDLNVGTGRVAAPFGNPYDFGIAVSFFVYYFALRVLKLREGRAAVLATVGIILCVLTQSRTAAVTIGVSLTIFLPVVLLVGEGRAIRRLALPFSVIRLVVFGVVGLALAGTFIWYYAEELAYLIGGLASLALEGQQASLDVRLSQIGTAWEEARANPLVALFGNGVSKASMEFLESTPAFYVYRYGFVGFLVIFLLPLLGVIGLLGSRVARGDSDVLDQAILVWLLSLGVASMGNAFTEQARISFLYYFLLGFVVRRHHLPVDGSGSIREHSTPPSDGAPR